MIYPNEWCRRARYNAELLYCQTVFPISYENNDYAYSYFFILNLSRYHLVYGNISRRFYWLRCYFHLGKYRVRSKSKKNKFLKNRTEYTFNIYLNKGIDTDNQALFPLFKTLSKRFFWNIVHVQTSVSCIFTMVPKIYPLRCLWCKNYWFCLHLWPDDLLIIYSVDILHSQELKSVSWQLT